jgi:hypothetical protein
VKQIEARQNEAGLNEAGLNEARRNEARRNEARRNEARQNEEVSFTFIGSLALVWNQLISCYRLSNCICQSLAIRLLIHD